MLLVSWRQLQSHTRYPINDARSHVHLESIYGLLKTKYGKFTGESNIKYIGVHDHAEHKESQLFIVQLLCMLWDYAL